MNEVKTVMERRWGKMGSLTHILALTEFANTDFCGLTPVFYAAAEIPFTCSYTASSGLT